MSLETAVEQLTGEVRGLRIAVEGLASVRSRPSGVLTSEQVMRELGISRNTFWRYTREFPNEFKTYKSGRWRVMDASDLEAWKDFCKREGVP